MELHKIKMIVSAVWVFTMLAVAVAAPLTWPLQIAIVAFGLLPPLALLLWWTDPAQTMSEAINEARRR